MAKLPPKPFRVQRSRQRNFKMPPNTIYVGRGSAWGNPFRVVQLPDKKWAVKTNEDEVCIKILTKTCHATYNTKEEATIDAINCYGNWLMPYTLHNGSMADFMQTIAAVKNIVGSLRGKNLACWCPILDKQGNYCQCHADFLLTVANDLTTEEITKESIKNIPKT